MAQPSQVDVSGEGAWEGSAKAAWVAQVCLNFVPLSYFRKAVRCRQRRLSHAKTQLAEIVDFIAPDFGLVCSEVAKSQNYRRASCS